MCRVCVYLTQAAALTVQALKDGTCVCVCVLRAAPRLLLAAGLTRDCHNASCASRKLLSAGAGAQLLGQGQIGLHDGLLCGHGNRGPLWGLHCSEVWAARA